MNGLLGSNQFGVPNAEALTGIGRELSPEQMKWAASGSNLFGGICPWSRDCVRTASEPVKSVTSATPSSGIRRFLNKFL